MFDRYDSCEVNSDGWVKGYGILNKKYLRYSTLTFNPDPKSVLLLNEYVELCKTNQIKLLFVQVPEHAVSLAFSKKYVEFNLWMDQFCKKNNLSYFDLNNEKAFSVNSDSLFFDSDHLNVRGAIKFSTTLADRIKTSIE